ncbi:hypothetical protein ID866_9691 [Astraeus odoratus]|nr:hypothetical protein ID866_9691 [Astraeus odoratus]
MLVVHPASYCDVCLDPYNITSEPTNSPHAIACGHIFCLTCLRNLTPSICPLCRKTFQQGSVKKLHLAVPPELDGASESPENAQASSLLQRVALVSGEDVPDAEVVAVLTEVDEWLSQHSDDANSNQPLRAAVASLQRYKALLDQTERDKVEHRRLRHQLKSSRRNADHDLKTSRAVEESLLSRIQELESEYALEVSDSAASAADEFTSPRLRSSSYPACKHRSTPYRTLAFNTVIPLIHFLRHLNLSLPIDSHLS